MMPRLVIRSGPLENQEFPLRPGTNHIGRADANDVRIGEPSISSSHCQIVVGEDAATIIDLNSTNGTFVNQTPVQSARLQAGDSVRLGNVECQFVAGVAAATPAPPQVHIRVASHSAPPEPPRLSPPRPAPVPGAASSAAQHQPRGFFGRLPGAFVFPFRGNGVLILIVATILFSALSWVAGCFFGILLQIAFFGYLFSFMQNILHATAVGDDALPELPGVSNFLEDLLLPFFRLLGVVLVSFGPALGLMWHAIANEQPAAGIAMIPAVAYGCLYFPMAFLAVAMLDSIAAVNPLLVVPSILKAPLEYLVTVVLLGFVYGVRWLGDWVVDTVFARSLLSESMGEFVLMVVVRSLWAFLALYLLTVGIRVLGLLYVSKHDQFGWIGR